MDKKDQIFSLVKKHIQAVDPKAPKLLCGFHGRNEKMPDSGREFLILPALKADRILRKRIYDELIKSEMETNQLLTGIIQNKVQRVDYLNTPLYLNNSQ